MATQLASIVATIVTACSLVLSAHGSPFRVSGSPYPAPSAGPNCTRSLFVVDTLTWSPDDVLTLETLQGVTARTCPSIWRAHGGSYATWAAELAAAPWNVAMDTTFASEPAKLLAHYKADLKGYVLCQLGDNSTNVALTLAAAMDGVVVATTGNQATVEGVGLTMVADARSMTLMQAIAAHSEALSTTMQTVQAPAKASFLADYSVFARGLTWFDADVHSATAQAAMAHGGPATAAVGWGGDELHTVSALSQHGMSINAADWSVNMAPLTGFYVPRLQQKPAPAALHDAADVKTVGAGDVHTVCFLMTDGDNVQWLLDGFEQPKWYGSPDRGKVPLGWTLSPALSELAPTVMNHFFESASDTAEGRDYFVGSTSGFGYMYPDLYDTSAIEAFANTTAEFLAKADQNILNVLEVTADVKALAPLTALDQVQAILLYLYSDYSGLHGSIDWSNGKPVIGGRFNLWSPQFYNVTTLAAELNKQPRSPSTEAGYSLVPVHVWSHTVADVVAVKALLDSGVDVVTPDVFVQRIVANLQPSDAAGG